MVGGMSVVADEEAVHEDLHVGEGGHEALGCGGDGGAADGGGAVYGEGAGGGEEGRDAGGILAAPGCCVASGEFVEAGGVHVERSY